VVPAPLPNQGIADTLEEAKAALSRALWAGQTREMMAAPPAKTSKPQNGSPSPQNEKLLSFNFLNPITF